MIDFLVFLLVLCLVFGLILWAIGQIPLPPPTGQIARVIVVVIFVLILLYQILPLLHTTPWRHG